jgi:uncharacterized protein
MNRAIPFLLGCLIALATLAIEVPYLTGRITDNAEVLSAESKQQLNATLNAYEEETTNQIAVLTVPSLAGGDIESYAEQVFNTWKLGRQGKDNGVLVLVAPNERRMRIEVGYGLEGQLTDVAASRIIRNVMTPFFKEGNFSNGVEAGVQAIIDQIGGLQVPADDQPPAVEAKPATLFEGPDLPLTERILIGAFVFGIIGMFTVIGILTPGIGWFLYLFLIPFWAIFPMVVVGSTGALYLLGTYLVGFPIVKLIVSRQPWYAKAKRDLKTKGRARIGGFTLNSGSSSWSSGSSSDGGFSGGGGSSGGGGASGSW